MIFNISELRNSPTNVLKYSLGIHREVERGLQLLMFYTPYRVPKLHEDYFHNASSQIWSGQQASQQYN